MPNVSKSCAYMRSDADKCLDPLRRPCLPHLQVLEIHGPRPYVVDKALFSGGTPSLRGLDLTNVTMSNWHSFRLSNLKSLSMRNIYPSQPTMVELLSILGCMHDLVDLHLHDVFPSSRSLSNADLNAFHGINLPHLSCLWVCAPLSTVVGFLSCVNTPPKAEVRLRCKNENNTSPDDFSQLSLLLAQKLCSSGDETPSVLTVRTLSVKSRYHTNTFVFSASERDFGRSIDENKTSWGCNIPLQLTIEFGTMMEKMLDISSDICRNVCPKNVQSVYVHGRLSSPPNVWESFLGHFQDLRYLKVTARL